MIAVDQLLVPRQGRPIARSTRQRNSNPGVQGRGISHFRDGSVIAAIHWTRVPVGIQQQRSGRSISRRAIFRCRLPRKSSVHGQGLKEVRRDGRLGFRRLYGRQAGRQGAPRNLLPLPHLPAEKSRLCLHPLRTLGVLEILRIRFRGNFWIATAIANAVWLLGDVIGHPRELLLRNNHAANNSGMIIQAEIITPLLILFLTFYHYRASS